MGGGVAVQVDGVSVQVAQERCNLEFRDRAGPTGPFTLGIQVIVSSVWVLLEVLRDGQELGVRVAVVTLPSLGLGHCRPRTETQGCCHSSDRVGRDHPLLEEPPQLKKKTANLHSLQSPIYFLNFVVLALSPPYLRAMPNPESPRFISTTFFLRVLWFQSLYLDISFSLVNFCKC